MQGPVGPCAVYGGSGKILGLAHLDEGRVLAPQRLFNWERAGVKGEAGGAKTPGHDAVVSPASSPTPPHGIK